MAFGANIYDNKHLYLESWDYTNIRVETLVNWRVASFVVSPFYKYDRTWYSAKPFSTFNTWGLTIDWPETSWLKGEIIYGARHKNFWYSRGDEYHQTGWDHRLDLCQGAFFPGYGLIRLGIFYDHDLAQGTLWASQTYGVTANGVAFLPWNLTGWLNFEYGYTYFANVDYWSQRRQQNNNYLLQLLLKKPLNEQFALWFGYGYANTRSNIPEWQYNRSLFQVQVTWNLY